jgi:predicted dehydrogenase
MLQSDSGQLTRLAIIGYGLIGQRHAEAIKAAPRVELAAIVEPEGSASRALVDQSVAIFADVSQMLREARPDGVIIASPTRLHILHARSCVQAGVPTLIEKPISDDLKGAQQLTAEAVEANVALLVGHHRRFNPIITMARNLIRSGEIGEVRAINAISWFYKPDYYFDTAPWRKKKGAGPVSVNLIHDIDLMRHFCGEVVAVQAQFAAAKRGYENEDLGSAILRFASGAIGTVTVSDSIASPWSWEFTSGENPAYPSTQQSTYFIGGSEGSISVPDLRVWRHDGDLDWWNPMQAERAQITNIDPLINQMIHFRRVILGLETPLVSGVEGTKSLEVIDAIQRAAVSQELVQLCVSPDGTDVSDGSSLTEVVTSSQ